MFSARSISEEFSSGDTRYKDNDETASSHGKERKDKEDRDEGIGNTLFKCPLTKLPIPLFPLPTILTNDSLILNHPYNT